MFYQSQGDPAPSYTIGVTNLSGGAVIETGKNDVLSFNVDKMEKNITLPAGAYTAETLLAQLNQQLDA
ncbi:MULTISPECIES: hypothetical protein [unclassified Sporosarcina]|uniref:hypothetical protein n=1 Tax=unclassified Sporosarcina TaxID=2647733 RepID=UPI00204166E0|nr:MULTISPECIES: hypothetical protein [unclassified Sporosarcina]GKV64829.1 hypothetical protein NCCP2331_09820 [Sporosarcina sp. NCCP-2331]GLB54939.1 hypothetical protein NCCP2378_07240 [Sporosarcina sp. NCCP-2378]